MELVVWERENQIVWRRREKERGGGGEVERGGERKGEGEGGGGRHCTCPAIADVAVLRHDLTSSKHQSLD